MSISERRSSSGVPAGLMPRRPSAEVDLESGRKIGGVGGEQRGNVRWIPVMSVARLRSASVMTDCCMAVRLKLPDLAMPGRAPTLRCAQRAGDRDVVRQSKA
jgi:hypothetical protein